MAMERLSFARKAKGGVFRAFVERQRSNPFPFASHFPCLRRKAKKQAFCLPFPLGNGLAKLGKEMGRQRTRNGKQKRRNEVKK